MIDRESDNLLADDVVDVPHEPRLFVSETRDRRALAGLPQAPPLGRVVSPRLPHHAERPETGASGWRARHRHVVLTPIHTDPLAAPLRDGNIHRHREERVPEAPARPP